MLHIVYGDVLAGRDHEDRLRMADQWRLADGVARSGRLTAAFGRVRTSAAGLGSTIRRGTGAPVSPAEVDRSPRVGSSLLESH